MKTRLLLVSSLACWSLFGAATAAEVETEGWRRGRQGPPTITLYERPNFGGASLEVELDEALLDLSLLRFPNGSRLDNKVSSIHVGRGAQVRIYVDDNFRGEFLELTRSVENLNAMARAGGQNWNDTLSSLRVVERRHDRPRGRDPSRTPRIIVFSRKDFGGEAFEIFPGESLDNLNQEHFESGTDLNDEISSISVVGPLKLRLYFETKNRGEFIDITSDKADLNQLRRSDPRKEWNDKASSLIVEWVGPPRRLDAEPDEEEDDDRGRDKDKDGNKDKGGGKDKDKGDNRGNF